MSNPQGYARPKDCAELPHAKTVTLGASTLSNPDSLILSLSSNTLPNVSLTSLVDSGSSGSFINSTFEDLPCLGRSSSHYFPMLQKLHFGGSCKSCRSNLYHPHIHTLVFFWFTIAIASSMRCSNVMPNKAPRSSRDMAGVSGGYTEGELQEREIEREGSREGEAYAPGHSDESKGYEKHRCGCHPT